MVSSSSAYQPNTFSNHSPFPPSSSSTSALFSASSSYQHISNQSNMHTSSYTSNAVASSSSSSHPNSVFSLFPSLSLQPSSSLPSFSSSQPDRQLFIPSLTSSQSHLYESTLSQALEQSYVDHFLLHAHAHVSAVHPESFRQEYEAAYCISSLLPPETQCLVALMASFGARFSARPLLPRTSGSATIRAEPACRTEELIKRGLDMVDQFGLLTKPSKQAVAALILAKCLVGEQLLKREETVHNVRRISSSAVNSLISHRFMVTDTDHS